MPLGIHTTLKDDLQCTTVELVYETTSCLHGEFFTKTSNSCDDPATYVVTLLDLRPSEASSSSHTAPVQHTRE